MATGACSVGCAGEDKALDEIRMCIVFCAWIAWAVHLVHCAQLRQREVSMYCVWLAWGVMLLRLRAAPPAHEVLSAVREMGRCSGV